MLDINELDDTVLSDILANLGIEDDEITKDIENRINHLSVMEAFDCYLKWNGIIGYTSQLISAYENIKSALIK